MNRLHGLLACLLLSACSATTPPVRDKAPPVDPQCASTCTTTCAPAAWPKWEGDPADARTWDSLGEVGADLREIADRCELSRKSCVQCLQRLERAGVVCGIAAPCAEGA